ncbi:hypothetical protein K9N68_11980 [Kovacikia minuta CCNUW1]|uniref:hypothetical protein n=1 Tax=Kovacikia minuta TaxID=2931930 RepID=UPI001CCC00CA|nr:hypothetical protein [Kovacikia minuta]UBF28525.1 hypothetical protein K9N68_11980 [Kovacikia minuta CCNUW1]
MAPHDLFEREVEQLINQGCNLEQAIQIAMQNYAHLAIQADELFKIKQRIARKMRQ